MLLWLDVPHDPAENMRRDEALLAGAEAGAEPVLRLSGFRPPGITLGHGQDPARELDLGKCARDGVPWAVRPTGGRAIYHDEEWTYALAAAIADPAWGGTLAGAYDRMARVLVTALNALGVPAALAAGGGNPLPGPPGRGAAAAPCFASTARHEVTLGGRKLVGSAQRRTARALLQQGSVLIGEGHVRLADYLRLDPGAREPVRRALARAATVAGPWLGADRSLARFADALRSVLPSGTAFTAGEHLPGPGDAMAAPPITPAGADGRRARP
jgi:lipoyl(octanoyl) transferase